MTRMAMVAFAGILLLDLPVFSKSADQLKSDFAALMPQGKKFRCAWGQGNTLFVVDSDNGVVRELTPASLFTSSRKVTAGFVTRDGQRVAFMEENSDKVCLINWDGTSMKQIANAGCPCAAWQHPDSLTQWLMVSVDGSTLINLDNFAQRRKIWTGGMCSLGDADGCGISVDGKRVGGFLCETGWWNSGIAPTPNGTPVCNECGGCGFCMRPTTGGVYEYGHFTSGHQSIHIHNADASVKETADISSTVRASGISGGEIQDIKWTSDPDYVMYRYGNSRLNPILFQLSTKKYVGVRDDASSVTGRPDGVFMPTTTVIASPRGSAGAGFVPDVERSALYTLAGRRLASAASHRCGDMPVNGVVICSRNGRVAGAAVSRVR